jgi:ADP-dependent phosphofructokinase/glucokinase
VSATTWQEHSRQALQTAADRAAVVTTSPLSELIACGFTNNVDHVVDLTNDLLAHLIAETTIDLTGPRRTAVSTPSDLVTAIVQSVAAGEGIDLPVSDPATQDWLMARIHGRLQLGGTGAQAANTLARLGFPTLLHHTGLSPTQASVFERSGCILVPTPYGLQPVAAAVVPDDPTMLHVALEYQTGLTAIIDGCTVVAPNPNRIIVSYDPVNAAFSLDPRFVDAVAAAPNPIRRILISGFSQVVVPEALARLLDETRSAIRTWRAARPGLVIHLELGAMPRVETLAGVVDALAPEVDSIGLNVDELRDLLLAWNEREVTTHAGLPGALLAMRRHATTPRLGLHSLGACLTLTSCGPRRERDALLFASLVASTRARIGTYPTLDDLAETLAVAGPHPHGIETLHALGMPDGIAEFDDDRLVAIPTIAVPHPAATVGLGDSFTAGLLAML